MNFTLNNFHHINSFEIESGKRYVFFLSKDYSLGKDLGKYLKKNTDLKYYYSSYALFDTRKKVRMLLKSKSFSEEEAKALMAYLKLDYETARCDLLDFFHKAIILINICLKNSDILVVLTAGMDYQTAQFVYNYVSQSIKGLKKAAIIAEYYNGVKGNYIELIEEEVLHNYEGWIKSKQ